MLHSMKFGLGLAAAFGVLATVAPANAQGRRDISWRGDVDDTVIVYFHGDRVRTETVTGDGPRNVSTFGRLPDRPVTVFLSEREGRGRTRIIQQPSAENDYTAAVRIKDPQGGRSHYEFRLSWRRPNGNWDNNRSGGNWNGNNDGRDRDDNRDSRDWDSNPNR